MRHLAVPLDHLVVSDTLALDQLALVECMAIGAHAVHRSELATGELAVVCGAGPIGMGWLKSLVSAEPRW
ncbi:hypothetical protein HSBAA_57220 [Vreelandella sulfidaeris]|uniref:Alcohol dehydrogenase-like C-terminal domain-containing protein n=1 Tax=Vreelandella sulfidaeris TaxID=115553 RepID=A0A455UDS3_9GAMM|nr:hypothetical protein HSBAA_57220 [Halomonas sulfidaeris]